MRVSKNGYHFSVIPSNEGTEKRSDELSEANPGCLAGSQLDP